MACDVMTVRLHLAQIRVLEVVEDTPGALVVSVESTFRRLRWQCGFKCHRVHDRAPRRSATWRCRDGAPCWCGQRRRMVCAPPTKSDTASPTNTRPLLSRAVQVTEQALQPYQLVSA